MGRKWDVRSREVHSPTVPFQMPGELGQELRGGRMVRRVEAVEGEEPHSGQIGRPFTSIAGASASRARTRSKSLTKRTLPDRQPVEPLESLRANGS